jgi:hypothetical protein
MFLTLIIGVVLLAGGSAAAYIADGRRRRYYDPSYAGWGWTVAGLGALAILVAGIGLADRAGQHAECSAFGRASSLPTKFYTYAGGWAYTCYAKVDNNWLPKEQVREFLNH